MKTFHWKFEKIKEEWRFVQKTCVFENIKGTKTGSKLILILLSTKQNNLPVPLVNTMPQKNQICVCAANLNDFVKPFGIWKTVKAGNKAAPMNNINPTAKRLSGRFGRLEGFCFRYIFQFIVFLALLKLSIFWTVTQIYNKFS